MKVIRKSIRLYDNNETDMEILAALRNFKDYGFESENQMIRIALLQFLSKETSCPDPERLADLIANRLRHSLSVMPCAAPESDAGSSGSEDEVYDAALRFLDSI